MRLSSIKRLVAGIAGMVMCAAVQPAYARNLDQIISSGELRVGYIVTPPNAIKDPASGKLSGFDVDAIREIAKQMGLKTSLTETDWGTFAAGLQADQFDVLDRADFRDNQTLHGRAVPATHHIRGQRRLGEG